MLRKTLLGAAFTAMMLGACGGAQAPAQAAGAGRFPDKFLFGTATAGFQIDMGCPKLDKATCEDPNSDWYVWVTHPELVGDRMLFIAGTPPSKGPGFFELYAQDLDRAANELHNGALRLSIEWSRVFPTSTVGVTGFDALKAKANPAALAFYHAVFAAMKARKLTPLVTLNHYTLPTWIHDAYGCHKDLDHCKQRGWLDRAGTVAEIAKYAGFVAKEFGGEVDLWATLNEPFTAVALAGYMMPSADRSAPPGVLLRANETKAVTLAEIEAHARMYDAVKAADQVDADGDGVSARVGLVYNLQAVSPHDPKSALDIQAVKNLSYVMNEFFLNAAVRGDVDMALDGTHVHRDDLAGRMDYLGVNYYARVTVSGLASSALPQVSPLLTFNPLTLDTNYADPSGMHEVLTFARGYGVPIIVTETGIPDPKDDGTGLQWLVRTLRATRQAIDEGVPVEGYFYWSLMDNYEWNHGMTVQLGLYGVDPNDPVKARHARQAVAAYGRITTARAIPSDLLRAFP
jgi:beta-glucosidase/6-phospho-beta-glucosidase/beta-galactosidase